MQQLSPLPFASAGVRKQWRLRGRCWSPLLACLAHSPSHLLGLLMIRAQATNDESTGMYARFEDRLATAFAVPRIAWPTDFGLRTTTRSARPRADLALSLVRVSPRRAAILHAGLSNLESSTAALAASVLEVALGIHAVFPLSDPLLASTLTPLLPTSWHPQWTQAGPVTPPQVFEQDVRRPCEALVQAVHTRAAVQRDPLDPSSTVALTFAAAAVLTVVQPSKTSMTFPPEVAA